MNRLVAYRRIEGITQDELGRRLGVSASLISAIEAGRRPMTVSMEPIGYSDARFALPEMTEPLHRHLASTKVSSKRRAKELLRLAGEIGPEAILHMRRPPAMRMERLEIGPSRTIEDLALEVRCGLLDQEEEGPIRNLTKAIELAGVIVIPIKMAKDPGNKRSDGIDGISSWVAEHPVIGLSPEVPGDRFRLTLAHELGHLVMHHEKGEHSETEANQFASSLLMSDDEFDIAMSGKRSITDFVNLKKSWGISVAALVYRAHRQGYIDSSRYRSLQIQMSKWRRAEPATFDLVPGQLLGASIEASGGCESASARFGVPSLHLAELTRWATTRTGHLRILK